MDFLTIAIGVAIIIYGLYTLFLRIKAPEKLGKLEAMKQRFGANGAMVIHTVAYTILPILLGSMIIFAGTNGVSIVQFFTN